MRQQCQFKYAAVRVFLQ